LYGAIPGITECAVWRTGSPPRRRDADFFRVLLAAFLDVVFFFAVFLDADAFFAAFLRAVFFAVDFLAVTFLLVFFLAFFLEVAAM
jgi:hypothetical protein